MNLGKVFDELMAIRARRPEGFGPETVVEEVEKDRNVAPEIAAALEWNDAVAGHRYRVEQARHIMARVTEVVVAGEGTAAQERRALHAVRQTTPPGGSGQRFVWATTAEVLATPADHARVLDEFLRQIRGVVRRYRELLPAPGTAADAAYAAITEEFAVGQEQQRATGT